ncbi:MAG: ATP-dependent Clp protease proteolytic subunit, partial [Bacteroidota bacterium]
MRQVLLSILACFAFFGPAFAQPYPLDTLIESPEGPVFEVPIEGMIDKALANYLDRALNEAEEANASVVILHMDTFGGLVDAADQMRTAILNTDVPVVTFIDRNAASAGALISLASDRIVMVPGASIGAATVVSGGSGEAAPDKYQSYMRGQMRATAEATGRDPQIAEAMVDETLEVKGVSPAGQVLTLSAKEALDVGFADAIMESIPDLTAALGVQQQELV